MTLISISLNQHIVTFMPTNKTFCSTKNLEAQIALVINIDSFVYDAALSRIIQKLTGVTADSQLQPSFFSMRTVPVHEHHTP